MPVIDMIDFEKVLISLMEEMYGNLEEALRNRGEFLYTVRDNATGYLRKKYSDQVESDNYPEFNRQVQMAYVRMANKIIDENLYLVDSSLKNQQKLDTRAIADF